MLYLSALLILSSAIQVMMMPLTDSPTDMRDQAVQCSPQRLYQPELFNIYQYPNIIPFQSSATAVNVMGGGSNGSNQGQVARWELSSTAKTCTFGWAMAAERSFSVYDNGLVRFQQMTGLPADNITIGTIQPFIPEGSTSASIDFTFWPEIPGPRVSEGGLVDCKSEVIVYLTKDIVNGGKGSVTLEQDAQNGLYLDITC